MLPSKERTDVPVKDSEELEADRILKIVEDDREVEEKATPGT